MRMSTEQIDLLVDSCIETLEMDNKNVLVIFEGGYPTTNNATRDLHKAFCRRMKLPVSYVFSDKLFRFGNGSTLQILPLHKMRGDSLHGRDFHQVITLCPDDLTWEQALLINAVVREGS